MIPSTKSSFQMLKMCGIEFKTFGNHVIDGITVQRLDQLEFLRVLLSSKRDKKL